MKKLLMLMFISLPVFALEPIHSDEVHGLIADTCSVEIDQNGPWQYLAITRAVTAYGEVITQFDAIYQDGELHNFTTFIFTSQGKTLTHIPVDASPANLEIPDKITQQPYSNIEPAALREMARQFQPVRLRIVIDHNDTRFIETTVPSDLLQCAAKVLSIASR